MEEKLLVVIISDNVLALDVLMRALCSQVNMPARVSCFSLRFREHLITSRPIASSVMASHHCYSSVTRAAHLLGSGKDQETWEQIPL